MELSFEKKAHLQERLAFIRQYAAWVKRTPDTEWSRQQADRAPQQPAPKTPPPLRGPEDVPGYVGYLVEENIMKMGMLAGAAIIGAALVLYYSQQTRWK